MPGQKFGPAWFPGLIAIGLILCGGLLAARSQKDALVAFPDWFRSTRAVAGIASVIGGLLLAAALPLMVLIAAVGALPSMTTPRLALLLCPAQSVAVAPML